MLWRVRPLHPDDISDLRLDSWDGKYKLMRYGPESDNPGRVLAGGPGNFFVFSSEGLTLPEVQRRCRLHRQMVK